MSARSAPAGRPVLLAAAARPADRVAKHRLLRLAAARLTDRPSEDLRVVQTCGHCDGDHGRPRLEGLPVHLSMSDAAGIAVAAASHRAVGVDLEPVPSSPPARPLLLRTLTSAERWRLRHAVAPDVAFARQWARKEALVKIGLCRLGDFDQIDLSGLPFDGAWGQARAWCAGDPRSRPVVLTEWFLPQWQAVLALAEADEAVAPVVDADMSIRRSEEEMGP